MKRTTIVALAVVATMFCVESCKSVSDYPIKRPRRERNTTKHFTSVQPQAQQAVAVK